MTFKESLFCFIILIFAISYARSSKNLDIFDSKLRNQHYFDSFDADRLASRRPSVLPYLPQSILSHLRLSPSMIHNSISSLQKGRNWNHQDPNKADNIIDNIPSSELWSKIGAAVSQMHVQSQNEPEINEFTDKFSHGNTRDTTYRKRFPARVYVISNATTVVPNSIVRIGITYSPYMEVYDALVMAAHKYAIARLGDENPFNVQIIWDFNRRCYTIAGSGEITSNIMYAWVIVVKGNDGRTFYKQRCIPEANHVLLRPGYRVELTYE